MPMTPQQRAIEEKDKGNASFKAEDYQGALHHYSRAIEIVPNLTAAIANRALVYIKMGKFSLAEKDTDNILKNNPRDTKALLRRGLARKSLGRFDEAATDFQNVLKLDKANREAQSSLAECQKMKVSGAASPSSSNFKEEDPGVIDAKTLAHIGELKAQGIELFKAAKYVEAVKYFSDALKECPQEAVETRASLLNNRAGCYKQIQQDVDVIKDCTAALAMTKDKTKTFKALLRRALSYEAVDKVKDAMADYEQVLRFDGMNKQARDGRKRCFARVKKENELDVLEFKSQGTTAFKAGKLEEAIVLFTKGIDKTMEKGNRVALLSNRCLMYQKLGRYQEAVADATSVIEVDPKNAKSWFRRAQAKKELKDYAGVRQDVAQAMKADASMKKMGNELLASCK